MTKRLKILLKESQYLPDTISPDFQKESLIKKLLDIQKNFNKKILITTEYKTIKLLLNLQKFLIFTFSSETSSLNKKEICNEAISQTIKQIKTFNRENNKFIIDIIVSLMRIKLQSEKLTSLNTLINLSSRNKIFRTHTPEATFKNLIFLENSQK